LETLSLLFVVYSSDAVQLKRMKSLLRFDHSPKIFVSQKGNVFGHGPNILQRHKPTRSVNTTRNLNKIATNSFVPKLFLPKWRSSWK